MINLVKLCVGIKSVSHLKEFRKQRRELGQGRADGYDVHRTRMMPKRRSEIINKGSIYWVIAGKIQVRQLIVDLDRQVDIEGKTCCDIIMDSELIRTVPQRFRPFQGWRYLAQKDAPKDLENSVTEGETELISKLSELGLL